MEATIASGIEMMLKALGLDPKEIERAMVDTVTKLQSGIQSLNDKMASIDARLERLENHLGIVDGEKNEDQPRRISHG